MQNRLNLILETIINNLSESNRARREYTKGMKDKIFGQFQEPDLRLRSVAALGGRQERDPIFGSVDRLRGFDKEAAAYGGPIYSETLPTGHPSTVTRGPLERFREMPYAFGAGIPSQMSTLQTMDYHNMLSHPALRGLPDEQKHQIAAAHARTAQEERMENLPKQTSQMSTTASGMPSFQNPQLTSQQTGSMEKMFTRKRTRGF